MKRVYLIVSGRVQGVGFREFTRKSAEAHGLTGWVRNLSDGTVEAVLHGDAASVDEVIITLREGPRFAEVIDLQVEDDTSNESFDSFLIRR